MALRPPGTRPVLRRARLISRGDSLQIMAIGLKRAWLQDSYVRLMSSSWLRLMASAALIYLVINVIFALAYLVLGDGIANARRGSFADAFFFSVQTMATIGYGKMWPSGIIANLLVTVEAFFGFCFFAMVTGLGFSKFSRPTSRVMFSETAVVCNYDGVPHLMLRLANERGNRIVDANLQLVVLRNESTLEGHRMRRFHDLKLVRNQVPLLQLTWTVMHRLDETSPLSGLTAQDLEKSNAEIILSLVGLDETLSKTIHARYSYVHDEIVFGAGFEDVLHEDKDGNVKVDYNSFHKVKAVSSLNT